jgi:hypothetical protein
MRPNRPHIPSSISYVKERASRSLPPKRLFSFCFFRSAVSAFAFRRLGRRYLGGVRNGRKWFFRLYPKKLRAAGLSLPPSVLFCLWHKGKSALAPHDQSLSGNQIIPGEGHS